jgi:cysteine desulfurase family protein (TIGR01976 family)
MTTLNFALSRAAARTWRPGDEIVTTTLDHDANISPWLLAARDFGLRVRRVGVRDDLTLDLEDLGGQLTDRTRVVAYTLASNAVGTVVDSARVAALAHAAGALAWVDGVHFAAHRRPDVAALGCDVLLCSPYKFFGPHAGVAWARRPLLEGWPADRVRPASESPPGHRFETGTASHEALAGVEAAVEYLASLGAGEGRGERLASAYARIGTHERELGERLLRGLAALPGVTVHGIADSGRMQERVPTVALTARGVRPRALAEDLGAEGIFAWDGNYYALAVMEHLGLEGRGGALRLGLVHYNTGEEVDRALEALSRLTGGSPRA